MPAAVLLFSMDGVPMIYAGQEIAETAQPSLTAREVTDWPAGFKKNSDVRKFYKKLISLRAKHPSLSRGQKFAVSSGGNPSVFVFASSYREDALLVAVNFSAEPLDIMTEVPEIFVSQGGKLMLESEFSSGKIEQVRAATVSVKLPGWGYQIWQLK